MDSATTEAWLGARTALTMAPLALLVAVVAVDQVLLTNPTMHWLPFGLLDEPAHVATVGLFILALGAWRVPALAIGMVLGSTLLDLDHIPMLLGSHILTGNGDRPYTHSLVLAMGLVLLGLVSRGYWRWGLIGAGVGIAVHLWRDLAVGGGVALFWPLHRPDFTISHLLYLASLIPLVIVAAIQIRTRLLR